jgi:hypothetical protein
MRPFRRGFRACAHGWLLHAGLVLPSLSLPHRAFAQEPVALTLTFTDHFDSQAVLRGAPGNNTGASLFGIRGSF